MTSSVHYKRMLAYLSKNKTIPSDSLGTLEERLVVACKVRNRNSRSPNGIALPRQEIKSKSLQKKAQKVYLKVLDEAPQTFLPFILVSSPKACQSFATDDFIQKHRTDTVLQLTEGNKRFFEDIAIRHNITESRYYLEVIKQLFPDTSLRLLGQPARSTLPFHFTDLLDFMGGRQDGQSRLQMICPFEGAPLPYIELDLGSGVKGRLEFSYEESVAFIKFISTRRQ
jgi:hypothetical protein